jgi:hypothetical protein
VWISKNEEEKKKRDEREIIIKVLVGRDRERRSRNLEFFRLLEFVVEVFHPGLLHRAMCRLSFHTPPIHKRLHAHHLRRACLLACDSVTDRRGVTAGGVTVVTVSFPFLVVVLVIIAGVTGGEEQLLVQIILRVGVRLREVGVVVSGGVGGGGRGGGRRNHRGLRGRGSRGMRRHVDPMRWRHDAGSRESVSDQRDTIARRL